MGAVILVLVVLVAAVGGTMALRSIRRRMVDERHSVAGYQRTIDTIRHVAEQRTASTGGDNGHAGNGHAGNGHAGNGHAGNGHHSSQERLNELRQPDADESSVAVRPTRHVAGRHVAGRHGATAVQREVAFDDARPGPASVVHELATSPAVYEGSLRKRSMPSALKAAHRSGPAARVPAPTPAWLAAAAVVLLAAGAAVALAAWPTSPRHTAASQHSTRPVTRSAGSKSTVTTAPITAATSTVAAATYALPAGSDALVLAAAGPCWVYATDGTGKVLWTGTLQPGQTRTLPLAGSVVVHLGAAGNMAMSVAGRRVALPAGFRSPFVATFQAA